MSARRVAVVGAIALASMGCNDRRPGTVTGDGGASDGGTTISYTERVCGFPFPDAMQVDFVASELCRCYMDLEYASEEACRTGLVEDATAARNTVSGDPTLCSCIMNASSMHAGAIDDFQRCLGEVYSDYLDCFSGAACGSGRQAECNEEVGMASQTCLDTRLTTAARAAIDACSPGG